MDITNQDLSKKCIKHKSKNIKFVQINNVLDSQYDTLFYCTKCVNEDLSFKGINYLLISQIIEQGQTHIIQKWPPVNDYRIIDKLIQETTQDKQTPSIVEQINSYFTRLREEIHKRIDLCQKKMINRALSLPFEKDEIIKKYQDISKIIELRSLLSNYNLEDQNLKEKQLEFREFISQIETEKERNTSLLQSLLDQCAEKNNKISFEYPNGIRETIFSCIDEINFFNDEVTEVHKDTNTSNNAEKIMELIQNKSNYCSQTFINSLRSVLQKLNPLLKQCQFENIFEQNKQPIKFGELDNKQLDMIQYFVDHTVKIKNNHDYLQEIQNQNSIKYMSSFIKNKFNFVSSSSMEILQKFLIDSYPLMQSIDFTNIISYQNKYGCFQDVSDEGVEDVFQLINKRKELQSNKNYQQSQTNQFQSEQFTIICNSFCKSDVVRVFQSYPIFDLMKKNKQINILPHIQFLKTDYQDGQLRLAIHQNNKNQSEVSLNQNQYKSQFRNYWVNCISNLILEKDKKYVFRIEIQNQDQQKKVFFVGLMQESKANISSGSMYNMCSRLEYQNNQISYSGGFGIDNHLKGDKLTLSKKNVIEMRICLKDHQLEVVDYPNYRYKVAISEHHKSNLTNFSDLTLTLGFYNENIKFILRSAHIVDEFVD